MIFFYFIIGKRYFQWMDTNPMKNPIKFRVYGFRPHFDTIPVQKIK